MHCIPFDPAPYVSLIKRQGNSIWDPIRKQWVAHTPEEVIRQLFIQYLITTAGISSSLIAVERLIQVDKMKKRFDIVIFQKNMEALMLIECKNPKVNFQQDAADQASTYNRLLKAPYLCLFNGKHSLVAYIDCENQSTHWLSSFPWDAG